MKALASISMRRTSGWTISGSAASALLPGSPALPALERVGGGVLVGELGLREALVAAAEPRGVHHDEHRREALVLPADQPAGRAVEVHHAGGAAVDAHLVLDRAAGDRVAAQPSGRILGTRNSEMPLRSLGRVGQLGEHQVDDVVGQVVLAARAEDLLAGDREAAVAPRLGLGADQAEVGAGLRLGERHRAEPFARDQLGQVGCLELVAAAWSSSAATAPWVRPGYMLNAWQAELRNSSTTVARTCGMALPAVLLGQRERAPAGLAVLRGRPR